VSGRHEEDKGLRPDTVAVSAGRRPQDYFGFVNPPVYHGSTVLYADAKALREHRGRYTYGSAGTPTTEALEEAIAALEGAAGCRLTTSGRSAILLGFLAVLGAGDHVLIADNVYFPARMIADRLLARLGIEVTYFDPLKPSEVAALARPNSRAVYFESPGSQTFEMADVGAIAEAAKARGLAVVFDNTWASPWYFKPYAHDVDVTVHAATKYIVGHSDAMLGAVTANQAFWPNVDDAFLLTRMNAGSEEAYLGHRGIRTLGVRLARHMASGIEMARWLKARPEVARVMHPALPDDPGHALWARDFTGASGLFGCVLKACPDEAVDVFLDTLRHFGMGASWGGYESLAIIANPQRARTATTWEPGGPTLRFHIGLEDPEDLKEDLARGFAALAKAM